jgi:hypothetical protein
LKRSLAPAVCVSSWRVEEKEKRIRGEEEGAEVK